MQIIQTSPVANQIVNTVLNNQATQLNIYQLDDGTNYGLYMDVLLNNVQIIGGVQCLNRNLIIVNEYLGYSGDFMWVDMNSTALIYNMLVGSDPIYTGLGTQYLLWYLTPQNLSFFRLVQ
jgi:hypothetical protein